MGEGEATDDREPIDPSDLIVGTMRLPAWVHRVPRLAWLFVALAAADVLIHVGLADSFLPPAGPLDVAFSVLWLAQAGAYVAMPAGAALGAWRGPARRAILLGGLSLAVVELIELGSRLADRQQLLGGFNPVEPGIDPYSVIGLVAAIFALAGPILLAIGVRWASLDLGAGRSRGVAWAIVLLGVATAVANVALLMATINALDAEQQPLLQPTTVASNALAAAAVVAWGGLSAMAVVGASTASRRVGWIVLAAGAALLVLASTQSVAVSGVLLVAPPTEVDQAAYLAFYRISRLLSVAGTLLVLVGLAIGPRPGSGNELMEPYEFLPRTGRTATR